MLLMAQDDMPDRGTGTLPLREYASDLEERPKVRGSREIGWCPAIYELSMVSPEFRNSPEFAEFGIKPT